MAESPFDADGLQFAWDSTSLTWAMDCLWKYKVSSEGYRAKSNSVHLVWGGWFASAVERFHRRLFDGSDREEALRDIVRQALMDTWGEFGEFGEPIGDKPWKSDHNTKTRENLIRTIIWYVEQFNPDPLKTVVLSDGRPAVEYSFSLQLDDGLVYAGHIDRLVEYQGDVYVQDQKTTQGTIGPYWFDNFNPDVQFTGYAFAGQAIYKSPVKGVIVDGVQVAIGFSRFERGFSFRTPAQLEEWYEDSLYFMHRARQATKEQYFPRDRTSCGKFGGCTFRAICSRSPEVRENFLRADFEKREPWNPLKVR